MPAFLLAAGCNTPSSVLLIGTDGKTGTVQSPVAPTAVRGIATSSSLGIIALGTAPASQLYRSTDRGATWTAWGDVLTTLGVVSGSIFLTKAGTLLLTGPDSLHLFRYPNVAPSGPLIGNWQTIALGTIANNFANLGAFQTPDGGIWIAVHASASGSNGPGIYESLTDGASWTGIFGTGAGPDTNSGYCVVVLEDGRVWALAGGGVGGGGQSRRLFPTLGTLQVTIAGATMSPTNVHGQLGGIGSDGKPRFLFEGPIFVSNDGDTIVNQNASTVNRLMYRLPRQFNPPAGGVRFIAASNTSFSYSDDNGATFTALSGQNPQPGDGTVFAAAPAIVVPQFPRRGSRANPSEGLVYGSMGRRHWIGA